MHCESKCVRKPGGIYPRVCKRWFPNGGSSLFWRANSRRQSRTTVWKPRFTNTWFICCSITKAKARNNPHISIVIISVRMLHRMPCWTSGVRQLDALVYSCASAYNVHKVVQTSVLRPHSCGGKFIHLQLELFLLTVELLRFQSEVSKRGWRTEGIARRNPSYAND